MGASKIAENVMSAGAGRPRLLGLSIILGAILWTGGIVGIAGSYLTSSEPEVIRYCKGKCICDGGSLDVSLMQRVCPDGWEKVFARARGKLRKERRRLRRERLRRMKDAEREPPEPSLVPSV